MFAWNGFWGREAPKMQEFEITYVVDNELVQWKAVAYAHSAQQAADVFRAANKGMYTVLSVRLVKPCRDVPVNRIKMMFGGRKRA